MRFLIFQHTNSEDVGSFTTLFREEGVAFDRVVLTRGEAIPALEPYDALWALGGPMDVWDVEEHPWLIEEKRAIRRFVRELDRPFLGICLGHQLLADALGGTCGPMRPNKDIGPHVITLNEAGRADPLFAGFSPRFTAMQWHSVRVAQLPEGAVRLASSDTCSCEAMALGPRAWGTQFHPEFWHGTLARWADSQSACDALDRHFGRGGYQTLTKLCEPWIPHFEANARLLLRNFLNGMNRRRLAA
jgi:GMP synthase-like glutamine amidotransferase